MSGRLSARLDTQPYRVRSHQSSGARRADGVTISELAARLGTTVRALRYYEKASILVPDRTLGNARCYSPEARLRAAIVVALRRVNVPLSSIDAAMAASGGGDSDQLANLLETRLQVAMAQVSEIDRLLESLRSGALTPAQSS